MNKIRKYLIHLLGGVTEEYCERKIDYYTRVERVNAIESVLLMMERCYGMPNDEWIKTAYDYTYARREAAVKNLEEYVNGSKNTVAGRINDARDRDRY